MKVTKKVSLMDLPPNQVGALHRLPEILFESFPIWDPEEEESGPIAIVTR